MSTSLRCGLLRHALCFAFAISLFSFAAFPTFAQTGLSDQQKAVVAFDLRVERVFESELGQSLQLEEVIAETTASPNEQETIRSIVRLFGAVSAPEDMDSLMGTMMGTVEDAPKIEVREPQIEGEYEEEPLDIAESMEDFQAPALPLEFFVQMKFDDASYAESMFNSMREIDYDREMPVNGTMMYGSNFAPENVRIHMPDETTIEIGTVNYLALPDRRVFSDGLDTEWSKVADDAVRLAVDVEGARPFINDAKAQADGMMPMEAVAIINLVDNISSMRASADLSSDTMLQMIFSGTNPAATEELLSGIEALLFMGKMAGKNMVNEMESEIEGSAEVFGPMVDSLAAAQQGNEIAVTITKPAGFDEFAVGVVEKMRERAEEVNRMNQFRGVAIAIHNFHDTYRRLPFGGMEGFHEDLSWRTRVVPFTWSAMDIAQDKSVDDPANAQVLEQMPEEFGDSGVMTEICRIVWVVVARTLEQISNTNGTSQTIMLLQNPEKVHWARNGDLTVAQAMELYSNLQDGESLIAVRYDASVFLVTNEFPEGEFRQMLMWK
ncbi:MAG: DUF1559 domain-containing protein [Planctomycetota bacterium]